MLSFRSDAEAAKVLKGSRDVDKVHLLPWHEWTGGESQVAVSEGTSNY